MMHIEKSKIQGIIVDVSIRGYGKSGRNVLFYRVKNNTVLTL